ncbi:DUF397 domain-containing protein [Streptomyces sp. NPDC101490]
MPRPRPPASPTDVRDSKNPDGPQLVLDPTAWTEFLTWLA